MRAGVTVSPEANWLFGDFGRFACEYRYGVLLGQQAPGVRLWHSGGSCGLCYASDVSLPLRQPSLFSRQRHTRSGSPTFSSRVTFSDRWCLTLLPGMLCHGSRPMSWFWFISMMWIILSSSTWEIFIPTTERKTPAACALLLAPSSITGRTFRAIRALRLVTLRMGRPAARTSLVLRTHRPRFVSLSTSRLITSGGRARLGRHDHLLR